MPGRTIIFFQVCSWASKNLRLVQEALGNEDLATTRIYTHIVNEELENTMKNLRNGMMVGKHAPAPLEKLGGTTRNCC